MKYLVLSDVHANFPAVQAVLEDAPEYEGVIFLGDMIGLYGYPKETVNFFKEANHVIKGNHDVAVIDFEEGHVNSDELSEYEYEYTWSELTDDDIDWIKSLSPYKEVPEEGVLMAHAKPMVSQASGYMMGNAGIHKKDYVTVAAQTDDKFNFVLLGHTHEQAMVDCSEFGHNVTVLNPGSAGQPMGVAEYAVVDTSTGSAELLQVEYDVSELQAKLTDIVPFTWW